MSSETMIVLALFMENCSSFIYVKDLCYIFALIEFLRLLMLFSRVYYKTAVYCIKIMITLSFLIAFLDSRHYSSDSDRFSSRFSPFSLDSRHFLDSRIFSRLSPFISTLAIYLDTRHLLDSGISTRRSPSLKPADRRKKCL